ncbi:peptidoglycan-binding protein [Streptomyces iakyrus]|uniref:peptidoglycan-binding domain-containing protein n=1 Tax=Streptomyces iakyrus TaxID=68219 RepID=UPI00368A4EA0
MEPPNGHPCPECGAPRQQDNTPACACTDRAAEALRDARTTQAAAAEDFDPLRIRPYVEIDGGAAAGPGAPGSDEGQPAPPAGATTSPRPGGPAGASFPGTPVTAPPAEPAPHAVDGAARRPATAPAEASTAQGPGRAAAAEADNAARPYGDAHRPPGNGSAGAPRAQDPGPAAEGAPGRTATDGSGMPPQSRAERTPGRAAAADGSGSLPDTEASLPGGTARPPAPADATMPLRPIDPVAPADPDVTAALPAASVTSALPTPLAPAPTEPSVTDLRMFDGTVRTPVTAPDGGRSGTRRPRRRSTLLLAAAGACVAVVAAAGYACGLFSYESPSRDTALPDDIRASVPDAPSSSAASTPPKGSASVAPPAPAAPRPSPSRTASPSASPSPSASASASPSQSPSPSASQPSASATGPGQAPPDNSRQNKGPVVLRLGDNGPEVTELQLRLRQLYLYDGDTDGSFDDRLEDAVRTYQWSRGIQVDDLGVYDRETRAKLESETREP